MQWVPLRLSPLGSNHVMSWPLGAQREVGSASTVMLCTAPIERQPLCVAIHSGFQVKASVSRRAGSAGLPDLVYMGLTGAAACGGATDLSCNLVKDPFTWILDDQVHVITRIVAVGSHARARCPGGLSGARGGASRVGWHQQFATLQAECVEAPY